jgi:hypothetical protein
MTKYFRLLGIISDFDIRISGLSGLGRALKNPRKEAFSKNQWDLTIPANLST